MGFKRRVNRDNMLIIVQNSTTSYLMEGKQVNLNENNEYHRKKISANLQFRVQTANPKRTRLPLISRRVCKWRTLIWLRAENFRPVISKIFMQVPICRPCFLVAAGYNVAEVNKGGRKNATNMKTEQKPTHQDNTVTIFIDLNV